MVESARSEADILAQVADEITVWHDTLENEEIPV